MLFRRLLIRFWAKRALKLLKKLDTSWLFLWSSMKDSSSLVISDASTDLLASLQFQTVAEVRRKALGAVDISYFRISRRES